MQITSDRCAPDRWVSRVLRHGAARLALLHIDCLTGCAVAVQPASGGDGAATDSATHGAGDGAAPRDAGRGCDLPDGFDPTACPGPEGHNLPCMVLSSGGFTCSAEGACSWSCTCNGGAGSRWHCSSSGACPPPRCP